MQLQKTKQRIPKDILKKIEDSKFVSLDVGCGAYKRKGAIGMDVRPLDGVDLVHDFTQFPWPIPDDVCRLVTANHVIEHVPKWGCPPQVHALTKLLVDKKVITQAEADSNIGETQIFSYLMRFLDECWRVSKVGGQLAMVFPYAGSIGFYQDPTHSSPITESTIFYFDPEHSSNLWYIYKPKPWKIEVNAYQVNGNMEVILSKRPWTKEYEEAQYV